MFKRVVHPGEVLKDELGGPGVSLSEFARQIAVPPNRVSQIVGGKRSVTGDTALRLGHWFGMDPQFWINLQAQYDLAVADREGGDAIRHLPTRASRSAVAERHGSALGRRVGDMDALTEAEAYRATYFFLGGAAERTRSGDLAGLLGGMSLLADGKPADPAVEEDWREAVARAKGPRRIGLMLSRTS